MKAPMDGKGYSIVKIVLLLSIAAGASLVFAAQEPRIRRTELRNLDVRNPEIANKTEPSVSATKVETSASASLPVAAITSRVRGTRIDRAAIGSPLFVRSTSHFLTGPGGRGGAVDDANLQAISTDDPYRTAKAFIDSNPDLFGHRSDLLDRACVKRDYVTAGSQFRTLVWEQVFNSIPVFEATLQAHLTQQGELINISSSFLADPTQAARNGARDPASLSGTPKIAATTAVVLAAKNIGEAVTELDLTTISEPVDAVHGQRFRAAVLNDAETHLVWLPMDQSSMRLCWAVQLTSKAQGAMYRVLIDAVGGEPLVRQCLTDDISPASYKVFTSDSPSPFSPGHSTPLTTQPALVPRTLVSLSALSTTGSPQGWIDDGVTETRGNNVDAHTDTNADNQPDLPRPQATGADRLFDPPLDLTQDPATYKDAAVVNLFYWCNWMHDKLYDLGFTEAAGNFQNNNFGLGGLGYDAVQADAQDGSGRNNANFSTPLDGSPGRMQMYVFTGPIPSRDGDFDAEIVLHEYTHGLSNRLVGGGVGMSALQSRGMGEGWSDFYAMALLSEAGDDMNGNYASGGYACYLLGGSFNQNYYYGIRRYPYTTDIAKNPLTFKDIDPTQASPHAGISRSPIMGSTANEVHNMGEVWCVTLWEARAKLIAKHGYTAGNQLILQLVTDGMKLAPANPNFLQARDAIIQADLNKTGGANKVELWKAFAKRGMGADAVSPISSTTVGLSENYDLPDDLSVIPIAASNVSGIIGGPFTPFSQTYTLTNTGAAAINWTATKTASWFTLNTTSGTLDPGASTTVTASINASANTMTVGSFAEAISFAYNTSSVTHKRTLTLTIKPTRIAYFSFDSNPGWTTNGEWEFGHPTGSGSGIYGYRDPANGATGANVYGVNLIGDYSTALGEPSYVTAGPFNLTGKTNTRVQFQRWLNSDYQPWVYATIEVSNNGSTWTTIWSNGTTPITDNAWTKCLYDISAVADNQATVYIRWGHRVAMSENVFACSGWNLDDVELLGTLQLGSTPNVSLSPSATSVPLGQTVSFTVAASCSLGLGEVGFEACNASGTPTAVIDSTAVTSSFTGQTYTWTPTAAGTYYFCGYAKNAALSQTVRTTPVATITVAAQAAAPTFNPLPGSYNTAQSVTISTSTGSSLIRYTTNGTTPTATTGTLYTGPVSISTTTTLKAIAYGSGMLDSLVTAGTYTIQSTPYNLATPTNQTVTAGVNVFFSASASGTPFPTFQWQVSTDGGISWVNLINALPYSGAMGSTLLITSATASLSGNKYRFIATNSLGSATSNAGTLTVNVVTSGPPIFSIQPTDTLVIEGTALNLYGSATTSNTLSYLWYKDGNPIAGATSTSYSKAASTTSDSGKYKLAATNNAGTAFSREATVTITPATPPVFVIQPQTQAAYVGDNITLTASAVAKPSPTYQWYKNGIALSGATGTSLRLTNITSANDGEVYTVKAINPVGNTASNEARLSVYTVDSGNALGISPATRTVGCGRVVYPITLRSNADWTATKNASWISLSSTTGKMSRTLEITVAPNPFPVQRTATITIGQQTHTLIQKASGTVVRELWAVGANDFGQLGDYRVAPLTYPGLADYAVQSITAGADNSLYIKSDGSLWGTGSNTSGQLGLGSYVDQSYPRQITAGVSAVSGGGYHSAFLKQDGTLWAMGANYYGQLGDNSTISRSTPVLVASNVTTVATGYHQTFFIKTDGSLWAAGYNSSGQLGDGTTTNRLTPVQIATGVSAVSSGTSHTLFIKTNGTLWGVGSNAFGQLGDGTTPGRTTPYQIATEVKAAACGLFHSLFVKTDGSLYAMGYNPKGQLGDGTTINRLSPTAVTNNVQSVAGGQLHSLFIKTDGSLWAMGENLYCKLGNGSTIQQTLPVMIASNVQAAVGGNNHTLFLKTDGTLLAAGANNKGQIGYASPGVELRANPICVASEVETATAGDNHSLFIKTDGTCWSMGENSAGQLGDGSTIDRTEPLAITNNAKSIVAGYNHSLLLKADGTLLAFGKNDSGQIGNGSSTLLCPTPTEIATGVAAACGGSAHTLIQKTDGTLFATGDNASGQLGDNSTVSKTSPFLLSSAVLTSAAGYAHSLFIKTDNSLWATGYNLAGELGNGNTANLSSPMQVAGTYLAISAGRSFSLLLKPDNTAWSTGINFRGQLGDGTYNNRSTPVQILTGVQALSAGQDHSLWLKTDNTVWASGDGSSGQLGGGSYSIQRTPVKVAQNVQSLSAGGAHSLFVATGDIRPTPLAAPVITNFTPTSIAPGSLVTITGSGFTTTSMVYFEGVEAASFTFTSSAQVVATAPSSLSAGKIVVSSLEGYATSTNSYTIGSSSSSSSSGGSSSSSGGGGGGAPGLWYFAAIGGAALARFAAIFARRR